MTPPKTNVPPEPRVTRATERARADLPPGGAPAPAMPPALPGAHPATYVPAHRTVPTDIPPPQGNILPHANTGEFIPVTGPTTTRLAQARTTPPVPAPDANRFLTLADDEDEGTGTAQSEPLLTPPDEALEDDDTDPTFARTRDLLLAHDRNLAPAIADIHNAIEDALLPPPPNDVLGQLLQGFRHLTESIAKMDDRIGTLTTALSTKLDDQLGGIDRRFTEVASEVGVHISSLESRQSHRIDQLEADVGTRITTVASELNAKLDSANATIASLTNASALATTDRDDIRRTIDSELTTIRTAFARDMKSNIGHITATVIPAATAATADQVSAAFESRLHALESRPPPTPPTDSVNDSATVHVTPASNGTPLRPVPPPLDLHEDDGPLGVLEASRAAWRSVPPDAATATGPLLPPGSPPVLKGGPILSPRNMDRERHAREHSVSRFDVSSLAHSDYHGHRDGYASITAQYLQSCGYDSFTADDVVTCFNDIISAHGTVYRLWTNTISNTSGPQVARILQKSLKLFPTLGSTSTDDVVEFYDRLQEVASSHLIGIMPFDAVRLRHRFEGLCIPGLGLSRYAAMAKALMELLPHLIPGRLSPQINAALYAVRYETANGYDYLWRVLELTVPGFDPVIPIQVPVWTDIGDIFGFSQAYLLYFRLQGKMNFHYDDRTRSGIFLRAVQFTELADTVTTLQSHVNSFRDTDEGYLPPHLRLHGLATSIHQITQARLRDIVSPRVRRVDSRLGLIQGPPRINRVGRDDRPPQVRFRDDGVSSRDRRDQRDRTPRTQDRGHDRPPRNQGRLARPDRNRRPFLPDVQCDACKKVGHVAKHCDMLATAICLERYMKHDLSASVRDSIERDWLDRWKSRLGNPDNTPRQVMRAYVEDLDITVATLDDAMEWDCWDTADDDDDELPSDASA